ncbi:putative Endoplasmic reticulum transmembrane protein [Seiridium unicorne]|uniref:Endoplasmic reticulum transmembrane protein n=1 Tax=Seiridium unicorne TaxID=138068 RepID=A0ABR2V0L7_9PEZI
MRSTLFYSLYTLFAAASSQLIALPPQNRPADDQRPLRMDPVGPGGPSLPSFLKPTHSQPAPGGVMLSDVMGKDRSINLFAGFTRDILSISQRLDDSSLNSTILAPLNSAVDNLPRKPWEDARDYETLGTNAYEGGDGQERAQGNLRRFAEAHIVPASPWQEKEKVKTLLGDRDVWWEIKDGKKVIQPDNIEVDSVASQVGNGEAPGTHKFLPPCSARDDLCNQFCLSDLYFEVKTHFNNSQLKYRQHDALLHPRECTRLPEGSTIHAAAVFDLLTILDQVFLLLVTEMALFMLLVIPMPFSLRRRIFTFISENPIIAKLQHGLKITFIFILILFVDSVNRVYRVQVELAQATDGSKGNAAVMGHERLEVQARKFYSQRNMYLCGFTLFLSLILNRTYIMILEVLRLEEKLKQYEGTDKNTKQSAKLAAAGEPGEISRLNKEIKKRDQDIETLKKQSEGLQREYHDLTEKYGATQAPAGTRKDK